MAFMLLTFSFPSTLTIYPSPAPTLSPNLSHMLNSTLPLNHKTTLDTFRRTSSSFQTWKQENMGRSPCCDKVGLKKGPWTPEEDQKLLAYIEKHGHGSWRALPNKAGLQRCGKSCRLRWTNYLRPDIKRGKFSMQEEQTIIQLHALLGNRWSAIATHLPKRTDNEIKNYWNTHLKKRLAKMGIDPVTHKPKNGTLFSIDGRSKGAANLNHIAQWESARLEAEARLVRESKLRNSTPTSSSTTTAADAAAAAAFFPKHQPLSTMPPPAPPCLAVLSAWQGVWSKPASNNGQEIRGYSIHLESPTSTLSFSENIMGIAEGSNRDELEWKCLRKTGFSLDTSSWLSESSGGDNAEGGSCVDVEEGEGGDDENKNYWSSILNLVNSSSSPNSPPHVF